jgi:hypothetical protein
LTKFFLTTKEVGKSPTLSFLFADTSDAALSRWNRDHQPHREKPSPYVIEWAALHENELAQCWEATRGDQPIGKIEPLI